MQKSAKGVILGYLKRGDAAAKQPQELKISTRTTPGAAKVPSAPLLNAPLEFNTTTTERITVQCIYICIYPI